MSRILSSQCDGCSDASTADDVRECIIETLDVDGMHKTLTAKYCVDCRTIVDAGESDVTILAVGVAALPATAIDIAHAMKTNGELYHIGARSYDEHGAEQKRLWALAGDRDSQLNDDVMRALGYNV